MTTLRGFVTMIKNPSNTLRSAFGVFAIGFALLFSLEARAADGDPVSIINFYTRAALSNGGSTLEMPMLSTSILPANAALTNPIQRQWFWQLLPDNPLSA